MRKQIWIFDPGAHYASPHPAGTAEALDLLAAGNAAFAELFSPAGPDDDSGEQVAHTRIFAPKDIGLPPAPGQAAKQEPFAAVLSCADARVPVEMIFGQAANDIFVVRVAGNVPGSECLGSLDFAVTHLGTVRALAVLGHTGCGAVGAAADVYLDPDSYLLAPGNPPLRKIVDSIVPAVRMAASKLERAWGPGVTERPGYRAALTELAVAVNAAVAASVVRNALHGAAGAAHGGAEVFFGVYNLATGVVGVPAPEGSGAEWQPGLIAPPTNEAALRALFFPMARGAYIARLLDGEDVAKIAGAP